MLVILIDWRLEMRQIKFRAWNNKHKYMDDTVFIRTCDGAVFDVPSVRFDTPNTEVELSNDLLIMQFTGLTDINGVDIYEGDIVRLFGFICCIKWEDSDASFMAVERHDSWAESGQEFSNNCTVIGNIYQNLELLK